MSKTNEWPELDSKIITTAGVDSLGNGIEAKIDIKRVLEFALALHNAAGDQFPGYRIDIQKVNEKIEAYVSEHLDRRIKALSEDLYSDAVETVVDELLALHDIDTSLDAMPVKDALSQSAYLLEFEKTRRKPSKGNKLKFDSRSLSYAVFDSMNTVKSKGFPVTIENCAYFGFEGLTADGLKYHLKKHDLTFTQLKSTFEIGGFEE